MARWTVADGDQVFVIESTPGEVSLEIQPGPGFITNAEKIRELRTKLGAAIGEAQAPSS